MRSIEIIVIGICGVVFALACGRSGLNDDGQVRDIPTADTRIVDDGGDFGYQVGESASFKFDQSNVPHISYYDRSNGNLKYATLDLGDERRPWRREVADNGMVGDTDFDVGRYTSMDIDPFGQPHISYYDVTNGRLKYAAKINGVWQIFIIDDGGAGGVGTWSSLVLDNNSVAHISYIDENQHNLKHASFNVNDPDLLPQIQVVDQGIGEQDNAGIGGTIDGSTGIAMMTGLIEQYPAISYYDSANGQPKVAQYNSEDGEWVLDALNYFIIGEQIEIAFSGAHVATVRHDMVQDYGAVLIYGGNQQLSAEDFSFEGTRNIIVNNTAYDRITIGREVSWSASYIRADIMGDIPTVANTGKWNSIYVDEVNRLHISYQDETYEDLRYAQYDGSVWLLEKIATEGNIGAYSSVTVAGPYDNADMRQPVVSFFDSTNNDLMIAFRRFGDRWDKYRMDTALMSGTWTTIDVISDGMGVGISYHDPQKDWLKFAYVNYF
jgi:hypothetical protein